MIILKSPEEIEKMRAANRIVVEVQALLASLLAPGVTTIDLDRLAEEHIRKCGAVPSFLGYQGYQHTLCTSVNAEVVHGIPGLRALSAGDVISIDCGVLLDGFHGDHAWTYVVGGVADPAVEHFLTVSREALCRGVEQMYPGKRLFDISAAVQQHVESHGYSVVRDYVGHGIGRNLHEEPQVPNFGKAGSGMKLMPGLVLAVEPMVNMGGPDVRLQDDGWTVETRDGSLSAHFEHSIAITEDGPSILSQA